MILNLKAEFNTKENIFSIQLGESNTILTKDEYYKILRNCEKQVADPSPYPSNYILGTDENILMKFKDCKSEYFTTIVNHLRYVYNEYLFETEICIE